MSKEVNKTNEHLLYQNDRNFIDNGYQTSEGFHQKIL